MTVDDLKQEADDAMNALWKSRSPARTITRPQVKTSSQFVKKTTGREAPQRAIQEARGSSGPFRVTTIVPMTDTTAKASSIIDSQGNQTRNILLTRFGDLAKSLPKVRPSSDSEKQAYYKKYAEMVRQEAIRDLAGHILERQSATDATSLDDKFRRIADHWIAGVRAYDQWEGSPLFKNKARGHGQADGSTDGRLRRKLVMAAVREIVRRKALNPLSSFYQSADTVRNDQTQLKNAESFKSPFLRLLYLQQKASTSNQSLNQKSANVLKGFLEHADISPAFKKALFLTYKKLRDPQGYKQEYSRVVPFGDDGWVKASHRFSIPANAALHLPAPEGNGHSRDTTPVPMEDITERGLPLFGSETDDPINDVGQESLGECWLQASAASLPWSILKKIFSGKQSHGADGVTTRLHDENGNPIYIRTQNSQLGHKESAHKALWPFALQVAVAKHEGKGTLRQFREGEGVPTRDTGSGMPLHSIRDAGYGRSIAEAAALLTGNPLAKNVNLFDTPATARRGAFLQAWRDIGSSVPQQKAVASFGAFDKPPNEVPTLDDEKKHRHAVILSNISPDGSVGDYDNTWLDGEGDGTLNMRKKRFSLDPTRMGSLSVLNPAGADRNTFLQGEPSAWRQRSLLGNFMV
ncbi:MAG: hypothetical protein LBK92_01155 [Endomicrobium sp.]|jgi:hypothetical protein|nr:hypothetical protein [Endomicrobium sp.]